MVVVVVVEYVIFFGFIQKKLTLPNSRLTSILKR